MGENNFKRGQIVEVRDSDSQDWHTAIYVGHIPNINYPYFVVGIENPSEKDIQEVINTSDLEIDSWVQCRRKSVFSPISIKLTNNYTANVEKETVKVGCTQFSFDAIAKLYEATLVAKNFVEPE